MSDIPPTGSVPPGGAASVPIQPARAPFPAIRLLYSIGFAILAWFALWVTLALALVQFVVVAVNGKTNDELKAFSGNLTQYVRDLLAFITFASVEQPVPVGPFPKRY